jgi:hypothetical protein
MAMTTLIIIVSIVSTLVLLCVAIYMVADWVMHSHAESWCAEVNEAKDAQTRRELADRFRSVWVDHNHVDNPQGLPAECVTSRNTRNTYARLMNALRVDAAAQA